MVVLGILFAGIGLIGLIMCLWEAYQEDTTTGVLCMLLFPYAIYYIITQIESPKKWVILGLMTFGVLGRVLIEVFGMV